MSAPAPASDFLASDEKVQEPAPATGGVHGQPPPSNSVVAGLVSAVAGMVGSGTGPVPYDRIENELAHPATRRIETRPENALVLTTQAAPVDWPFKTKYEAEKAKTERLRFHRLVLSLYSGVSTLVLFTLGYAVYSCQTS